MKDPISPDPWHALRSNTPARIAIGRTGNALPTREVLDFSLAHARARDAVHASYDRAAIADELALLGVESVEVNSQAVNRSLYLRRPDLGRKLDKASRTKLKGNSAETDLTLVIADGLSSAAVESGATDMISALLPELDKINVSFGPVVLACGARVALGDEIGALTRSRLVAMIIGERPGLSAADCLSIYLTYEPRSGRNDAERNCISNIRKGRLEPAKAASSLGWLIGAALKKGLTGVELKDKSDAAATQLLKGD